MSSLKETFQVNTFLVLLFGTTTFFPSSRISRMYQFYREKKDEERRGAVIAGGGWGLDPKKTTAKKLGIFP
jgi:hypothetical protein